MIRLKTLLSENISANRYSWLNPRGVFIPTKNHVDTANQIIKLYKLPYEQGMNVYDVLWKLGYMRIINMGNGLIVHNAYMTPSKIQMQKLIDLANEAGDIEIEYDTGGRGSLRTLWSKSDFLQNEQFISEHINDYSWLAPDGKFYPTHDHEQTAKSILYKMSLSPMDKAGIEYDPYNLMYKHKFLRIVNMANNEGERDIYATNRYNLPTNIQIKALTDFAIEHNYSKVIFTKDRREHFTIWDKAHRLE